MGTTGRTYKDVIGLTGPLLPVVSFLARLPTATIQFGSVLLVVRTSGSPAAAGLTGGAPAAGQVSCGPLVGRPADRHGRRTVVLVCCLANAVAIAALVAGALAGLPTAALALLGASAGATVPLIGPLGRARPVALARRSGAPETTGGTALSFESTLDETSFVLGPRWSAWPPWSPTPRTPSPPPHSWSPSAARASPCIRRRPGATVRPAARHARVATAPACRAPATPCAPPSPSRGRCSVPVRRASPRSPGGSGNRTRQGSSMPPWA
ncbi:hypothetical protein [Streptomyces sp. NPDC048419]|uniref:hypothetical protein n=1 Tax=Streptomyces sp. NPDC048419 TaxID=3365547 RepID=UPI00371AADA9